MLRGSVFSEVQLCVARWDWAIRKGPRDAGRVKGMRNGSFGMRRKLSEPRGHSTLLLPHIVPLDPSARRALHARQRATSKANGTTDAAGSPVERLSSCCAPFITARQACVPGGRGLGPASRRGGSRGVYVVFVNHAPDALLLGESSQVALHEALLEEVFRDLLLAVHLRDRVLLV